ncbi:hypothetical protein [Burkholderia sp. GS2Y]|uniref:Uncharacterized protein n=1 Tax=Burkholderia theae TaxID=3143496 RepID=A0ABU9WJB3_9BURK
MHRDDRHAGICEEQCLDAGHMLARSLQHVATAADYTIGDLMTGGPYSKVRYMPGNRSIFTDTAIFNTYAALAMYRLIPAFDVSGGRS